MKKVHRLSNVDRETKTATCSICGPVETMNNGTRCKTARKLYEQSEGRVAQRRARQRKMYKAEEKNLYVTHDQRLALLEEHGYTCAICSEKLSKETAQLDHCHTTGKHRGFLCRGCNTALGFFKDDVKLLEKAIEYLSM